MRPSLLVPLLLLSTSALASPRGNDGGGNGSGRLGQVSSGIRTATNGGGNGSGARSSPTGNLDIYPRCPEGYRRRIYDERCVLVRRPVAVLAPGLTTAVVAEGGRAPDPGPGHFEGYVAAQKVFESDGALTAELAIQDSRFRLTGAITRYYEGQLGGTVLTMTMPSLAFGVRIDDSSATRVILEGGVVGAKTHNDPVMDSSITGALLGVRVEHAMSPKLAVVANAHAMAFQDDVQAGQIRAGVRYGHIQAAFTVLDFNVGPALYGPELGVRF
ncbi:MAG TPA: hypothetical protein VFQ53_03950 [Kofleriaceae bacterium]|nr:hypothetical protein [Kofleriaceae bacterium]